MTLGRGVIDLNYTVGVGARKPQKESKMYDNSKDRVVVDGGEVAA